MGATSRAPRRISRFVMHDFDAAGICGACVDGGFGLRRLARDEAVGCEGAGRCDKESGSGAAYLARVAGPQWRGFGRGLGRAW